MAAFSDRQASILSYCRIDDPTPEDLSLLEGFHADAVSYMEGAGVTEPEAGSARLPQYNTCILALVLDAWDSRGHSDRRQGVCRQPGLPAADQPAEADRAGAVRIGHGGLSHGRKCWKAE